MTPGGFSSALYSILGAAAVLGLPPLIAAIAVGVFIGLGQAVTQLQEQSLPQSAKLIVVAVLLGAFGATLAGPLVNETSTLFSSFYLYGRQ